MSPLFIYFPNIQAYYSKVYFQYIFAFKHILVLSSIPDSFVLIREINQVWVSVVDLSFYAVYIMGKTLNALYLNGLGYDKIMSIEVTSFQYGIR